MKRITAQDPETRSPDMVSHNIEKLRAVFPEAFTEGKVDFEVLKQLLGDAIDEREEKYGLTWHGKRNARIIALTPSTGTLRPCPGDSVDWDTTQNLMIEGDNLEVLKLLQKSYASKIKLIYIDPPYNTGNDFIYPDKYQDNLGTYLRYTGQIDDEGYRFTSNTEGSGRKHTNWLNMMYPRLKVARNLLKDDGVLFISIDDGEVDNLTKICDEIFGEENHVASITVVNNMKGRNDEANVATCHEYLLIYTKGTYVSYGLPLSEEQISAYRYEDENGERYDLRDLRKRGRPDRREDRPNMFFPIYYDPSSGKCSLDESGSEGIEILPKRGDGSDGRWRWGRDRAAKYLQYLHPRYSAKKDRWDIDHRVYLNPGIMAENGDEETDDDEQVCIRTSKSKSFWWGGEISTDVANREFKKLFPGINPDYPKSPFLMERILHMSVTGGDIVLDFFAGYGTTAHAVMNMNQHNESNLRFIMVQLPEKCKEDSDVFKEGYPHIAEICKERLRRAGNQIKQENQPSTRDIGFRVFKLDSSNIRAWEPDRDDLASTLEEHAEHLRTDRTEQDILFELLLKLGLDLTVPIEQRAISGKTVQSIGAGALLVCLATQITAEEVELLALGIVDWHKQLAPAGETQVVFRDSAFANDVAKTNLTAILEQHGLENVRSI